MLGEIRSRITTVQADDRDDGLTTHKKNVCGLLEALHLTAAAGADLRET